MFLIATGSGQHEGKKQTLLFCYHPSDLGKITTEQGRRMASARAGNAATRAYKAKGLDNWIHARIARAKNRAMRKMASEAAAGNPARVVRRELDGI